MTEVILKPAKEKSIHRFHPWVFSGAIHEKNGPWEEGLTALVYDSKKNLLGEGHIGMGSISVRLLTFFSQRTSTFWKDVLEVAWLNRSDLLPSDTTCFRWIHGEGDGLSGLIIDVFGSVAVVQCHTLGMYLERQKIAEAIAKIQPKLSVFCRSKEVLKRPDVSNEWLLGKAEPQTVVENGVKFHFEAGMGQKTGFFLDQRDNRALVGSLSKGKSVLNCFSYTGGFSLYALQGGAEHVTSVDISKDAILEANAGVLRNGFSADQHTGLAEDVLPFLTKLESIKEDLVILDPPAFAKSREKRHNAMNAYKRLNALAIKKMKSGALLFTFSCSQVVDRALFESTIMAAAIEVGRPVQVLHYLSQGADHPINIFHAEGHYLKGLLIRIV
jgi:23S rRNA (cytosine1962-C5)-methyltransferase